VNPNPPVEHLKQYQIEPAPLNLADRSLSVKVEWDVYHYIKSKSNPSAWMREALAAAYQQEIIQQNPHRTQTDNSPSKS
jgi:hypothetical protein